MGVVAGRWQPPGVAPAMIRAMNATPMALDAAIRHVHVTGRGLAEYIEGTLGGGGRQGH